MRFAPDFAQNGPNGELAKDICAMANNGQQISYLIIGVSDDGKNYRTCDNKNLTDDRLQDFCKLAINPPPKVNLEKLCIQFDENPNEVIIIVIKIGPQKRQAFCLNQDFIDYQNKIVYRRNEVWIRRNKITDLATPNEIARLVKGQAPFFEQDSELLLKIENFSKLSLNTRLSEISNKSQNAIRNNKYKEISFDKINKILDTNHSICRWNYWKRIDNTIFFIFLHPLHPKLDVQILKDINSYYHWNSSHFIHLDNLPRTFSRKISREDFLVRKIYIIPTFEQVSKTTRTRIQNHLREWQISQLDNHYFRSRTYQRKNRGTLLPTSEELLIIDNVKEPETYEELFSKKLFEMEKVKNTFLIPELSQNLETIGNL